MCTIALLLETHPRFPLLVAANRDEFFGRPSTPPVRLGPGVAGGRDLEKGGTWLGVTAGGFFAGLTNLRPEAPLRPAPRSRGEVVMEVLSRGDVGPAAAWLSTQNPSDFNGFNLLFGRAGDVRVAYVHPGMASPHLEPVPPGVHVLPTARLDTDEYPKVHRLAERLHGPLPEAWPELRAHLTAALADHTLPPLEAIGEAPAHWLSREQRQAVDAVCIHLPVYGTRSSALLALAPGAVLHYEHAEGPPCRAPFEDYTALLQA